MSHDPRLRRLPVRKAILLAVRVSIVGALPVFLVGGLGLQIASDLELSLVKVGLGVSTFFLASTMSAALAGRAVERMGPWLGMRTGAALAATSSLGIALGGGFRWLLGALIVGGAANAFTSVSASLFLLIEIPRSRRGLAFGAKQAAIPAAMMIGGLSVPGIALTIGWRWAFGIGCALSVLTLISVPTRPWHARSSGPEGKTRPEHGRLLPLLAAAAGLGSAAASNLSAFFVASAVASDVSPGVAGVLLAAGSGVGILVRLGSGVWADRHNAGRLRLVSRLLVLGALGVAALMSGSPAGVIFATLAGFAGVWGWSGLMNFAVVDLNPSAPATAAGIVQTGVFAGGIIGPAAFGFLAERWSYGSAWLMTAAGLLGSSAIVYLYRKMIPGSRQPGSASARSS